MSTERIELVGEPTTRGVDAKAQLASGVDQLFINCLFELVKNPVTGKTFFACDKRPGLGTKTAVTAGLIGRDTLLWSGATNTTYQNVHVFSNGTTTYLYRGTTSYTLIESFTADCQNITETLISGEPYVTLVSASSGWHSSQTAMTGTLTFTADTTNGSPTLATVSSMTGLLDGQGITGTGIPASTRLSISGATVSLVNDSGVAVNATASNSGVTMTRTKMAKMVSVNFPGVLGKTLVGAFVHLDGFAFVMDSLGNIYNSDINSLSAWTSTSVLNAQSSPDAGVGLGKVGNLIVSFGAVSAEFFQNAGNQVGSPLVSWGKPILVGCADANSILNADDTLYWVGGYPNDQKRVYRLEGLQAKPLSSGVIESDITQTGSQFYLSRAMYGGKPMLFVTSTDGSSSSSTWAYQMNLELWSRWRYSAASTPLAWGRISRIKTSGADKLIHVPVVFADGGIYVTDFSSPSYLDDALYVDRIIRAQSLDFGTRKNKTMPRVRVVGDKTASTYTVSLQWQDSDYGVLSTARSLDMSTDRPQADRLGMFTRRAFLLTDNTANANCRIQALDVDVTPARS